MPKQKRKKVSRILRSKPRNHDEQFAIGYASIEFGNQAVQRVFQNTTPRQIKYYKEKVQNDSHWNNHGGLRKKKQKVDEFLMGYIIILLTFMCDFNPTFSLFQYQEMIFYLYGIEISLSWISNTFNHVMSYSYRKINVIQKLKFTEENINYYYQFSYWTQTIDCCKIKYIDESHFDSRKQKPR